MRPCHEASCRLLVLGLVLTSLGCTQRLTDFTVLSTKNVDLSAMARYQRGRYGRIQGEDAAHAILLIPLGVPNLKEAVDRAIESVPGCVALVDGVVYRRTFSLLVWGVDRIVIEGTPLIDPQLLRGGPSPPATPYGSPPGPGPAAPPSPYGRSPGWQGGGGAPDQASWLVIAGDDTTRPSEVFRFDAMTFARVRHALDREDDDALEALITRKTRP